MDVDNIICPACIDDIPDLVILVNGAYRGESAKSGWTNESNLLEGTRTNEIDLRNMINNIETVILKSVNKDGKIIGCVSLRIDEKKLYLGMLTVAPDLQAKGLGKKLLLAAEHRAREMYCDAIKMTVISLRLELISWYKRHGFADTGITEEFPTDPTFGKPLHKFHFIVMEKVIS